MSEPNDAVAATAPQQPDGAASLWTRIGGWMKRNPIGVGILILAVTIPFLLDAVGLLRALYPPQAQLEISAFDDPQRVRPTIAGKVMSTPDGPVYPHGVEVSVALSSSVRSDHDVVVRDATLEVEKFEPGRREDLDYVSIKRRDLMEVRAFEVELDGATVLPAVLKTGDRTLRSRSTNILDFETPRALRLSKLAGSTEELSLRLAPTKVGFYVVRLRLRFRVGADDQELLTGPLRIYYAGAE